MTLRKIATLPLLMKYPIWAIIIRIFNYYLEVDKELYSSHTHGKTCSHYVPHVVICKEVPSTTKVFFPKY